MTKRKLKTFDPACPCLDAVHRQTLQYIPIPPIVCIVEDYIEDHTLCLICRKNCCQYCGENYCGICDRKVRTSCYSSEFEMCHEHIRTCPHCNNTGHYDEMRHCYVCDLAACEQSKDEVLVECYGYMLLCEECRQDPSSSEEDDTQT